MPRQKTYRLNSEKLAWRNIEGEAVILNLDSGYYYRLNSTGTYIWQMLEQKKKPEEIIKSLAAEHALPKERVEKDFESLIKDFKKEGLIS